MTQFVDVLERPSRLLTYYSFAHIFRCCLSYIFVEHWPLLLQAGWHFHRKSLSTVM